MLEHMFDGVVSQAYVHCFADGLHYKRIYLPQDRPVSIQPWEYYLHGLLSGQCLKINHVSEYQKEIRDEADPASRDFFSSKCLCFDSCDLVPSCRSGNDNKYLDL